MPGIVWIWLAAVVLFLILELVTPAFFFASFSVAAVLAGVVAWIWPEAYYWQMAIFAFGTIGLIPFARRIARRMDSSQEKPTNVDRLIGKVALVVKPITPMEAGQIKLSGEIWNAVADVDIAVNEKITIVEITGTRVRVEPIDLHKED